MNLTSSIRTSTMSAPAVAHARCTATCPLRVATSGRRPPQLLRHRAAAASARLARRASLAPTHAAPAGTSPSTAAAAAAAGSRDFFASDKRPIILYDGVCNMCNGGVNQVLQYDTQGLFRLAALQSNAGRQLLQRCGRAPDDLSSIVLVEEHGHFTKSEAVLRIGSRLNMPLSLLVPGLGLVPRPLLDVAYDQVAANRYSVLGRTDACRLTSDGFADRFILD